LGEQLILQESVTHSINLSLPPLVSILGAAAFAAGERLAGTICFGSQTPPTPLMLARHCSRETKPQFVPPPTLSIPHHLADWPEALPTNPDRAASRQPVQIDNLTGVF
jgi:predicted Abi (CAAX) family protease